MERLSDRAIEILDNVGTDRLGYHSEYLPLIEAAHKLAEYEATGLEPSEIQCAKENLHILDLFKEQAQDAEECIRIAEARREPDPTGAAGFGNAAGKSGVCRELRESEG